MHIHVYNMIEDHYRTSVTPTAIQLRTADRSPMSFMGKANLHLWIADFKFSHGFIICNRLPETDFLFGTDLQKWYSLPYYWDSDRQLFIQREGSFLPYTRNREGLHNIAVVKSTLNIPLDTMVPYQLGSRDMIKRTKWYILSAINIQRRDLT